MAHELLDRVAIAGTPSHAGLELCDPRKHPPKTGVRLKAAILWYKARVACAPAVYQMKAALDGIHSEMELQLAEGLRGTLLGFRPDTQDQLQEEMEREAKTLEEDTCHLCPSSLLNAHAPSRTSGAATPRT